MSSNGQLCLPSSSALTVALRGFHATPLHDLTQMELANQELERTQQRAAELALERDTLQQRLEAAHEELEAVMAAAEGGGESEGRTRGESAQSEQEPSGVEGEKSHRGARHSRGKGQSGGGKEAGEGFWERQVSFCAFSVLSRQFITCCTLNCAWAF